ncbi:MAG: hypothetical protein ACK2US_10985, partial [Anaerolineae bacterium]
MSEIVVQSVYFEKPGKENTPRTLEIAKQRADALGVKTILIATTRGDTGAQAAQLFQEHDVVVV